MSPDEPASRPSLREPPPKKPFIHRWQSASVVEVMDAMTVALGPDEEARGTSLTVAWTNGRESKIDRLDELQHSTDLSRIKRITGYRHFSDGSNLFCFATPAGLRAEETSSDASQTNTAADTQLRKLQIHVEETSPGAPWPPFYLDRAFLWPFAIWFVGLSAIQWLIPHTPAPLWLIVPALITTGISLYLTARIIGHRQERWLTRKPAERTTPREQYRDIIAPTIGILAAILGPLLITWIEGA
ncbi:hypothetical protein [Citricoccus sp. GCM10030269]|uniref:hypothetical protein n=1 Tax=Citricoccus sp. GCM10030269 TaxID=3273388 RepID=UPI0036175278